MIKKTLSPLVCLFLYLLPLFTMAQSSEAERKYTAYDMRSNGKIYVLTACILIILIGFLLYLVRLDRKISRVEKEIK
ncbi:MAG TPA: CcmD family protein [Puia sp.]